MSEISIKRENTVGNSGYNNNVKNASRVNSQSLFKKYNQPNYMQILKKGSKGRSLDPNSPNYLYNYVSLI